MKAIIASALLVALFLASTTSAVLGGDVSSAVSQRWLVLRHRSQLPQLRCSGPKRG